MELKMEKILKNPAVATTVTLAAAFSFYILCMMLSLVGPSGSKVPHAAKNQAAFLSVLFLTLLLAGCSIFLRLKQCSSGERKLPWFSVGLCVVSLIELIVLFAGGFSV